MNLSKELGLVPSLLCGWRSIDRLVKEIDKKLLSPKVKEIDNLYEAIETGDRIFLVLEYCSGGDLSGYINRHGKVSEEAVAKHFMRQLALGLQVLQEKHFIHRDFEAS